MKKNFLVIFLVPLTVGIFVAIFQFLLPKLTKEKKELTYLIHNPISIIDNSISKNIDLEINGLKTKSLYSTQIVVENTGNVPLKNIPVSVLFETEDSTFSIYNHNLETVPKIEFGKLNVNKSKNKIRLLIELFNQSDKINLNVLTNKNIRPDIYSKTEAMVLSEKKPNGEEKSSFSIIISIVASGISVLLLSFFQSKGIVSFSIGGVSINFDMLNKAKGESGLKILSATYGKNEKQKDVTSILSEKVEDNRLKIVANNKLFGDPIFGIVKELKVVYSFGKEIETVIISENEELNLPINNAT